MAPERLRGDRYGWASDVWSVGVITLEALTAIHPFDAARSFLSLSMAICEKPSPVPPEGTPGEICEFIALCLLKEVGSPSNSNAPASPAEPGGGGVRALPSGLIGTPWMQQCGRSNPVHELQRYLEASDIEG